MKLKLAYFGTPYFSAEFLEKIITDTAISRLIEVKLVVTQPDKPVGRRQIITPTPVKETAKKYGIEIYDKSICQKKSEDTRFERLGMSSPSHRGKGTHWSEKSGVELLSNKKIDIVLLYAFSQIIPKDLLTIPKYGFWNIHPSLLPHYRGPSPIAYPLILGDNKTGVTIIKMDEQIDHGPIISQQQLDISPTDCRPDLEKKLTSLAFEMFKKLVSEDIKFFATCLPAGRLGISSSKGEGNPLESKNFGIKRLIKQNHQQATYTRLLKKSDGFIPLPILKKALNNEPLKFEKLSEIIKNYLEKYPTKKNSCQTFNLFKGLYPWPGLWTLVDLQKMPKPPRFYKKQPSDNLGGLMKKRLKITDCDLVDGKFIINKVQLEGKKEVDFQTFNKAYQIF